MMRRTGIRTGKALLSHVQRPPPAVPPHTDGTDHRLKRLAQTASATGAKRFARPRRLRPPPRSRRRTAPVLPSRYHRAAPGARSLSAGASGAHPATVVP